MLLRLTESATELSKMSSVTSQWLHVNAVDSGWHSFVLTCLGLYLVSNCHIVQMPTPPPLFTLVNATVTSGSKISLSYFYTFYGRKRQTYLLKNSRTAFSPPAYTSSKLTKGMKRVTVKEPPWFGRAIIMNSSLGQMCRWLVAIRCCKKIYHFIVAIS